MTKVTLDAVTLAKLASLGGAAELCDESGHSIGFFHPSHPPGEKTLKELSPFSDDEIRRRREDRNGRPLKEILRDLEGQQ